MINLQKKENKEMKLQKGTIQKGRRSFQVSMPVHYHTTLKILSIIGRTNTSELLRCLLEPYLGLVKNVLIESGYTGQWGQLVTDTDEILESLQKEVANNPEKFLNKMSEYGKENDLKFPFVKVDKMF